MDSEVNIIGAGLAGSEAAWQMAQQGIVVRLWEMRPQVFSSAHHTPWCAELVCSNSFRGSELTSAPGLLKEEMRRLGSLIMRCADQQAIPAGGALAVDRERFAQAVTQALNEHPLIHFCHEVVQEIDLRKPCIVATGPLTAPDFAAFVRQITGEDLLSFYDAAAPIVTRESLDFSKVYWASRYQKGDPAYLNCPFTAEEYQRFWENLHTGERFLGKDQEELRFFEGCMPVEVLAERGIDTLRFGPMKPVGLEDPRKKERPHAVVQLRQDNREGSLFNLVGFQTQLKWPEQERIFRLIPGLEQAEFVRLGAIHRNTYINSPRLLKPTLEMRKYPGIFFAGQITGVEGYVESAASGLVAGINLARQIQNLSPLVFPVETAHGALLNYITTTAIASTFQPMNIAFGLVAPLPQRIRDRKARNLALANRALQIIDNYANF